jgi:hypothetical protein
LQTTRRATNADTAGAEGKGTAVNCGTTVRVTERRADEQSHPNQQTQAKDEREKEPIDDMQEQFERGKEEHTMKLNSSVASCNCSN